MEKLYFYKQKFFKLNKPGPIISKGETLEYTLKKLYIGEVERQGLNVIDDDYVDGVIAKIAGWLRSEYNSCLIAGGIGLGKTLMLRILAGWFDSIREPITIPPSVWMPIMYIDATEWSLKSLKNYDIRAEAHNCKILIIDDVGSEEVVYADFGNKITPIKDVILARYAARLPTVIATNLTFGDFAQRYGDRVVDRLNEMYAIINYPPRESFRRVRKVNESQIIKY